MTSPLHDGEKRFLSIWLPTFAIDRLRQATRRHVDGRIVSAVPETHPFALVLSGQRGLMITAINECARKEGIEIGQTLADARAAIPQLLTKPAELERDRARLYTMAYAVGRYGPGRNVEGDDGLWVDITGVSHLFGNEAALSSDCIRRFKRAGYRARIGIANTPAAAFALARYGRASDTDYSSAPGAVSDQTKLANLPIEALRLGAQTVVLLKRLGLRRIGQLYDLPRVVLARRFRDLKFKGAGSKAEREGLAQAVLLRLDQALGQQADLRQSLTEPPVFITRRSYPDMLITSDGIEIACHELARDLCDALSTHHKGARRLRFSLYRADGSVADAMIGTSQPCRQPDHLIALFRDKLSALDAGFGIDMIVLEALHVDSLEETQSRLTHQNGMIDRTQASANTAALVDRLTNRLGRAAVFQLDRVQSHIPERAQRRIFSFSQRQEKYQTTYRKRPPFLLAAPEMITVMAEVPEGPPARFTWRRVMHRILKAQGPERIAPEWWRSLGSYAPRRCSTTDGVEESGISDESGRAPQTTKQRLPSKPLIRDYYILEDDSGARYWVFRSGLYQREAEDGAPTWYMHGLFG
ncbi:MAG: DNA polymerase Y family protein [Pseudomonadota bacterium]